MASGSNWCFLEERRVVLDPTRGVVAHVRGTVADGAMLAGAHRMFNALAELDHAIAATVDDAHARALPLSVELVAALNRARQTAAMALIVAGEPTEH